MFASLIPALGFTSLLYLILKLGLIGFIVYLITTHRRGRSDSLLHQLFQYLISLRPGSITDSAARYERALWRFDSSLGHHFAEWIY